MTLIGLQCLSPAVQTGPHLQLADEFFILAHTTLQQAGRSGLILRPITELTESPWQSKQDHLASLTAPASLAHTNAPNKSKRPQKINESTPTRRFMLGNPMKLKSELVENRQWIKKMEKTQIYVQLILSSFISMVLKLVGVNMSSSRLTSKCNSKRVHNIDPLQLFLE